MAQAQLPFVQMQPGKALDLGNGARLEVLAGTRRGAVLLLEWDRIRALLPVGLGFETMGALLEDRSQPPLTALLLVDSGHASLNTQNGSLDGGPGWRCSAWRPREVNFYLRDRLLSFFHFEDFIRQDSVSLTMHRYGSFCVWCFDKTKESAGAFIVPVLDIINSVSPLDLQVPCMGRRSCFGGQSINFLMYVYE
jgi:hypothetical protein